MEVGKDVSDSVPEQPLMNWEALTALSTAFTGLVIVATAIGGFAQIRQLREQRRDTASVELVRIFQDNDFVRAFDVVMTLPEDLSADELRSRGPEYLGAVRTVAIRFEMVGALVYRRTISFEITQEVCGGATVAVWHRLKAFVEAQRLERTHPLDLEWFEWLADQFEKRRYVTGTPARIREQNWKPKG
ncbi:MAG: hypothetical protein JO190_11285 [Candidatus Eremiobacteraeota bacterium]|nr:hypothetical protein [Candidatus Eremiobacteraeota bacterium]